MTNKGNQDTGNSKMTKLILIIGMCSLLILVGCEDIEKCSFREEYPNMIEVSKGTKKNLTWLDNEIYCCNAKTNKCYRNPGDKYILHKSTRK